MNADMYVSVYSNKLIMGIDLATWRARIGLNYYHMCRPLQTRWMSSGGRLYQPGVASCMGGGGGHEWHTPGAQGLHGSCHFVTDTPVHSSFLVQTEREGWGWQGALPLERAKFSSEGDSKWWENSATQSHCGGDTSTAGDSRWRGNKPRTWRYR